MSRAKQSRISLLAAAAIMGLTLAGCGTAGGVTESGTATAGAGPEATAQAENTAAGNNKILVATQSPLSGPLSNLGDTIKSGAEYAIKLKQEEFKQLGFDLQLFPQDDQADPKQGVANAELLIANPAVLGVIGHLNTGVSIPASVKYESAHLVMISPTNTGVQLTEEGRKVVHRICARDDQQGPKAAKYAQKQLGVKSVFIIHDKTAYGQGLSGQVKAQFEQDGVKVLGYEGVTPGEKDYSAMLNQVTAKKPDMVYMGTTYAEAGILVKQGRDKGFAGIFMGGDAIDSSETYRIAGPAIEGVIFTTAAGDVTQTEQGKQWVADYEKTMGKKPETYAVYAFDSTNVLLNGILEAMKANGGKKPSREQVLASVHKTKDFQGEFSKVSFDEKGDNTFADIFVYKYGKERTAYVGIID
jgi:branched-chain amino acid transport system substrate-binding protein